MIVLFALKIFIVAWKWALRTSRRFSPRTLRLLTAYSIALFVLSWWVSYYNEHQTEWARPNIVWQRAVITKGTVIEWPDELILNEPSMSMVIVRQEASFNCYLLVPPLWIVAHEAAPEVYNPKYDPFDIGRLFRREQANLVQVSGPERADFQHTILFWLSLIGMVVSPVTTIATLLLTWISLHRRRAEALLMRLELEKRRLEIEQLRLELERARKEHEASDAAAPKIVLLS